MVDSVKRYVIAGLLRHLLSQLEARKEARVAALKQPRMRVAKRVAKREEKKLPSLQSRKMMISTHSQKAPHKTLRCSRK